MTVVLFGVPEQRRLGAVCSAGADNRGNSFHQVSILCLLDGADVAAAVEGFRPLFEVAARLQ